MARLLTWLERSRVALRVASCTGSCHQTDAARGKLSGASAAEAEWGRASTDGLGAVRLQLQLPARPAAGDEDWLPQAQTDDSTSQGGSSAAVVAAAAAVAVPPGRPRKKCERLLVDAEIANSCTVAGSMQRRS